jgi:hypothetical protein
MSSSTGFEALLPLCSNQACRKELKQFASDNEVEDKAVSWVGKLDVAKRTFAIKSVDLLSTDEAAIRDVNAFLQLQANGDVVSPLALSCISTTTIHPFLPSLYDLPA